MKNKQPVLISSRKTLVIILFVALLSPLFTVGVARADRAQDYCNEKIPVTNSTSAGENASCVTSSRNSEQLCADNNGTGNQAWINCVESIYSGANTTPSGGSSSSNNSGSSGSGVSGSSRDSFSQNDCEPGVGEELSSSNCGIIKILVNVINFLSAVAGIALVASMMISGYQYMTAQDNASQIEKSKSRIIQTLIALALFVFMYALLNFLIPGGLNLS